MEKKIDIYKAAGILIKDRKFLGTRSKGKKFFISPGGKIQLNESIQDALKRELYEELKIDVDASDLQNFGTFFAVAKGEEDKYLQMDVLIVSKWKGHIIPSNEIEETMWIDSKLSSDIELGSIFKNDVLPKLKSLNLIN